MDKIYEKKLNKSLPSVITENIIKNDDDKNNELVFNNNNNNKNGVCFKNGITTNCCSSSAEATSVAEIKNDSLEKTNIEDIRKNENDNNFTKLKSQSTEFLNSDKILKLNDIRQLSSDSIADQQSTNNSTDNLSYLSDCKCVAEEVFLSDDELSKSSDDCIYAYRGGGAGDYDLLDGKNVYGENVSNNLMDNINNHNRNLNEDETDFLEMDFEPDPLSELEQSIEFHCQNDSGSNGGNNVSVSSIGRDETGGGRCNGSQNCSKDNEDNIFLAVMANKYSSQTLNTTNEQKILNGCHSSGDASSEDCIINSNESDPIKKSDENNALLSSSSDVDFKMTGAKRKKCLNKNSKLPQQIQQLPFKSSTDLNRSNTEIMSKIRTYPNHQINQTDSKSNYDCYKNDMIMTCLDCIEKEFLSKTFGKNINSTMNKCLKCSTGNNIVSANSSMSQIRNSSSSSSRLSNFNNLINKNDDEKFLHQARYAKDKNLLMEAFKSNEKRHQKLENQKSEQVIPKDICCGLDSNRKAKFLNLNITEKTIIQALEQLGVTYNKDIISEHFNAVQDVRTLDIPELIVHMSKKNCDYKRIIRLIRMACKENLHVEFIPDSNIVTTPSSLEIVEVSACDILRHWNRKNDLDKLKKLNKRFSEMNVLGKIVSLLRQVQQRNIKPLGEYIEIPNYYKTGYICITKIS